MMQLMDLSKQVNTVAANEIAGDHVGKSPMNPTPNGRAGNIQLWKEVAISGLTDCLLDPVVVSPPRVRSLHLGCIGRRVWERGPR